MAEVYNKGKLDILQQEFKQWGTFTNRTCVFPIQFTESCFCALHQPINLSNDHLSATNWAVYNLNTKGFSHGDLSSNHFFMVIGK